MGEWTKEDVAERFVEAVDTARRLPRVKVQGYFNVWPKFKPEAWETANAPEPDHRSPPPPPAAIDRMMETMHWVQWLEIEQRHLIWMRAKHYEWRVICRQAGCDRTTAWRRWQRALQIVAARLNAQPHRAVVF